MHIGPDPWYRNQPMQIRNTDNKGRSHKILEGKQQVVDALCFQNNCYSQLILKFIILSSATHLSLNLLNLFLKIMSGPLVGSGSDSRFCKIPWDSPFRAKKHLSLWHKNLLTSTNFNYYGTGTYYPYVLCSSGSNTTVGIMCRWYQYRTHLFGPPLDWVIAGLCQLGQEEGVKGVDLLVLLCPTPGYNHL